MRMTFHAGMADAMKLMRAGSLAEATDKIRAALAGGITGEQRAWANAFKGQTIDLTPDRVTVFRPAQRLNRRFLRPVVVSRRMIPQAAS
jgi:hypothetical protein